MARRARPMAGLLCFQTTARPFGAARLDGLCRLCTFFLTTRLPPRCEQVYDSGDVLYHGAVPLGYGNSWGGFTTINIPGPGTFTVS